MEKSNIKICPHCKQSFSGTRSLNRHIKRKHSEEKLNKVHKEYYKYPELQYTNSKDKIKVECPEHGSFEIIYHTHQSGSGCSKCAVSGYKDDKPGILYYLRVEQDNEITYKVGITNNNVKKRYGGYMKYITVVHTEKYEIGLHARMKEKEILDKYSEYKYAGPSKIGTGNAEVFTHDVLNLDPAAVNINFDNQEGLNN